MPYCVVCGCDSGSGFDITDWELNKGWKFLTFDTDGNYDPTLPACGENNRVYHNPTQGTTRYIAICKNCLPNNQRRPSNDRTR